MIRKVALTIVGFVWLCYGGFAQSYPEEALMISQTTPGGTARINAMGGVQNALGGDLSSAFYNPAGLGMYNRSEFSISPSLNIFGTTGNYLGTSTAESRSNFMIPNLGVALHSPKDGAKGFWGGTFAITYNRMNDFNRNYSYKGTNNDNSIIDSFIQTANGGDSSQFAPDGYNYRTGDNNYNSPTGLGYYNFLIGPASLLDPTFPKDQYFTFVSGIPFQSETIKRTGSQNQWNFSYGVNFSDRFYVGGAIGLASFDYRAENTYTETFDKDPNFSHLEFKESLSLSGTGFNFTLGTIIRPMDEVQFGISATTPTTYSVTDNYSATMSTVWNSFTYPGIANPLTSLSVATDPSVIASNYNLKTPWRVTGGVTFFLQKKGFISADLEWKDYSAASYSSPTDNYSVDNSKISGLYRSVFNIRVGGEYRMDKFRFRGGYSYMPSPYQTDVNGVSATKTAITFGGGYRMSSFSLDLAVILGSSTTIYTPYTYEPKSPTVQFDNKPTLIMLTLGLPF